MSETGASSPTSGVRAAPVALSEETAPSELGPAELLGQGPGPGTRREPHDASPRDFATFYDRELPSLVALARAMAGAAVAEDLAQEAMISAYRHWGRISRYDRPEAWVRRVCVNMATSVLRRRAAEARALMRIGVRPESVVAEPETETFWTEVRRLPRRQAQAIALRYVYDLDLAAIAHTMDCSEGSVKVHLSRARATLAARLLPGEEVPS